MVTRPGARGSTQDDVRRHNLGTLLTEVHRHGRRSRAQLTAEMGLNRSTIGDLVAELTAAGLVAERASAARGRAGRPSLMVAPRAEETYVLAIDLGVRHLVMGRIGLGGQLLDRVEVPEMPSRGGWSALHVTVEKVAETARLLRAAAPASARCVGAGLSVPGVIRRADGLLRFAPNLGWVDLPLGGRLSERLGLPVVVGNEADLAALAEHWRGVAAGCDEVIVMSGEVGVGGGIIAGGRPLRGRGGYAGEIGHLRVNPDGRGCRCGSWGCLETEIGVEALLRAAGWPTESGIAGYREVIAAVAAGDPGAIDAAERVGRWLGAATGMLINTFNPEIVVYCGPLGELFTVAEECVRTACTEAALAHPREQARLAASAFGTDTQLVGAAEAAFGPLLADPIGVLARTEPARTEPARTEPARTEPARTEPARTEPARTEPTRSQPTRPGGPAGT
jgi:predicted NBD/HSP70 family sugar kinase